MTSPSIGPPLNALKNEARALIERERGALRALSDGIHQHPQIAYEEVHAHRALTDFLERRGFAVERHAFDLTTAFIARSGSGRPAVALLCEYDALPGIGHACGHNLVAAAGVAAALGAGTALESGLPGSIVVVGCPAEERYGGKADLIERGAFEHLDAAMMTHTSRSDMARPATTARHGLTVTYTGRPAHAAGAPWQGLNALDALVIAYQSIGLLRQQVEPDSRLHMIITDGGSAPNIIPELTRGTLFLRAPNATRLFDLRERVEACLQGAAIAAGCRVEVDWEGAPYLETVESGPLAAAYVANMAALGVAVTAERVPRAGSTDMGNVTHVLPAIQPVFLAPGDVGNHTPEFAAVAGSDGAFEAAIRAATGMAWTVIDLLARPELMAEVEADFASRGSADHRDTPS